MAHTQYIHLGNLQPLCPAVSPMNCKTNLPGNVYANVCNSGITHRGNQLLSDFKVSFTGGSP